MTSTFGYGASGASPPTRHAEKPNAKPTTPATPAASTSADEAERLQEPIRAVLINALRSCSVTSAPLAFDQDSRAALRRAQ